LADSSNGIFDCANTALAAMGVAPASREAVNATIGLPLRETFSILTGENDALRRDKFVELFHSHADKVMVSSAVVFEFVPEALRQLREQGISLAVASTKRRKHIEAILQREGLHELFAAVIGSNDVQNQKPHPESLHAAMAKLEVSPEECLYVGDSIVDAEAAQRANIKFIAVLTGVTRTLEFNPYPSAAILNHIGELPPWLKSAASEQS